MTGGLSQRERNGAASYDYFCFLLKLTQVLGYHHNEWIKPFWCRFLFCIFHFCKCHVSFCCNILRRRSICRQNWSGHVLYQGHYSHHFYRLIYLKAVHNKFRSKCSSKIIGEYKRIKDPLNFRLKGALNIKRRNTEFNIFFFLPSGISKIVLFSF